MVTNQTQCLKLEQRPVVKFLVAEKCKPCEIYRRMCVAYRQTSFSPKDVYKWAKHWIATPSLREKDILYCGNTFTCKEKVLGAVVNKEGYADRVLRQNPSRLNILEKR